MELDELSKIMGSDSMKAALDRAIKSMEEATVASAAIKEAFDSVSYQMAYKTAVNNGFIKKSEGSQKPKKKPEPPRPQTFGEWS
ncbi:Uncharacterised protein [Ectopseudomonas mendocina]|uniref:Uncharacterized protein n=1 Tax=Ectopseudomonas mendocina TaxID=300 RepID=A0A379PLW5_ECTME|nr:hypothetical protein [Pseudomonas mendocina]SUE95757.1 Uncharacterised protein [Pseudomonas mendocina]